MAQCAIVPRKLFFKNDVLNNVAKLPQRTRIFVAENPNSGCLKDHFQVVKGVFNAPACLE
ncbi:hypothetical protein [Alysiella filiformis]|uniref:hypothetical protein n=1 Tax=Alysiella filiformis TaxID=194196 RepID=UPI000BE314BA|nr:hypothetical protein [Alysiella filiformis]QMT30568.1 hypothetical protein H3L97_07350 [Alysiella filiformis]UBQ56452.1 hypothetical protein JF568_01330 [Alysiella filiformis DSM 16848]